VRLVGHQTLDPAADLLVGILRAALERCTLDGIHTLEHVGCGVEKTRLFDQFAPYRRKLPAWPFYYKAADPALDAALRNPAAWDPSSYDGDASL
jgi:hypothetical protein